MEIRREFLGCSTPALVLTADYLLNRYRSSDTIALAGVALVVPGRRAGRSLLEVLLERADAEELVLMPPQIVTAGTLPELLYKPKRPFAGDMAQRLAWTKALKETDRARVAQVFPRLPSDEASDQWLRLGSMLWRLHRELAADALDFSDVAKLGPNVEGFDERSRWQTLRQVQEAYLHVLDDLQLWDVQTARLYAIDHRECRADKDVVLVGTVDMNRALRQMLDQVADRVTALVFAPESWADRFDQHGCLVPEAWQDVDLDLRDEEIQTAEDAAGQAELVVRQIANYEGRYRADEITIGVPDERLVPQLERALDEFDVPSRWLVGRTLPETGPYKLLAVIRDYISQHRAENWAELVRHPDIDAWLERQGIPPDWLNGLDEYRNDHLQPRFEGKWLGAKKDYADVADAFAAIKSWLAEIAGNKRRNLNDWTEPIMNILSTVYGTRVLDRNDAADEITIAACRSVAGCLNAQQALPPSLVPPVTAAEAIDLVLEQLSAEVVAAPGEPDAIEILGWLELPLDDAPALIVTSFNERFVPTSTNADLFLPEKLRRQLGLDDNLRRYARDAYALTVLKETRKDLLMVVARRDTDGNPLAPSRLLFAAAGDTIAQRVLSLSEPQSRKPLRPLAGGVFVSDRQSSRFDVPRPVKLSKPITAMRVTAFRDYLKCPYRFYLQHVLGLSPLDDRAGELDALAFGNVIHDVLHDFANSEVKDSTDADQIREFLDSRVDHFARRQYGAHRLAPVNVQLFQIKARLAAFAKWQAARAGEGWRIEHSEVPLRGSPGVAFDVDGEPIMLRGRIDRIDTNDRGQWMIFDYKSSSTAKEPDKVHRKRGEWVDLQLPLYRHIAAALGVTGDAGLGYIVLPKDTSQVDCLVADWSDADLLEAEDVARDVVRRIRREEFWPPAATPEFAEDYAPIAMDDVFERPGSAR